MVTKTSPRVETPTIEFTPSGPISISREQQARDVFRSRSTGGGGGGSSPAPTPMVESTPEQVGSIQPSDPREVEAEIALTQESQKAGRNLFLSERDTIIGGIFGGTGSAEISEREKSIQTRKEAFGSLGVLTPGESERATIGFFKQQSLVPERPFITKRQVDTFEPRPGEQIPVFETVFVDPETGFVGPATREEEAQLRGLDLTVESLPEPGRNIFGQILPGQTGEGRGGLILLRKDEEDLASGFTSDPAFVLESETFPEAFLESRAVGGVSVSRTPTLAEIFFGVRSKGQRESNEAQIQIQKKGFRTERDILGAQADFSQFQQGIADEFAKDPFKFEGETGFTRKEVKGGFEVGLGEEFFKSSREFAGLDLAITRRKEFESRFDDEGFLKLSEFKIELGKAREKFKGELTTRQKAGAYIGDLEIGTAKSVLLVSEFALDLVFDLGVSTSKPGEFEIGFASPTTKKLFEEFGLPREEIISTPVAQPLIGGLAFVKEMFTETPGYVAETIPMALAAFGAGTTSLSGLGQTAKILSPIRIKEGVFLPVQSELALTKNIPKSFSLTAKGETIAFTEFTSKDFGFKLESTQFSQTLKSRKTTGKSFTQLTDVPFIKIELGGARTSFGRTNIDVVSRFEGAQFGGIFKGSATSIFESDVLGVGGVKDVPVIGLSETVLQSGKLTVSRSVGGRDVSGFRRIDKTFDVGREAVVGIESPVRTGGITFDISNLFPKGKGGVPSDITFIKGRGTQTPLSKTFGSQVQTTPTKPVFDVPKSSVIAPIIDLKTISTIPGAVPGVTTASAFGGGQSIFDDPFLVGGAGGLVPGGSGLVSGELVPGGSGLVSGTIISPKFFPDQKIGSFVGAKPSTGIRFVGAKPSTGISFVQPQAFIQPQIIAQIPALKTLTTQIIAQTPALKTLTTQITQQKQTSTTTPFTPFQFDFRAEGRGGFPLFPPIPFGIFDPGKERRFISRKVFRTPSFFGVQGRELGFDIPKFSRRLEQTGLVSRRVLGKQIKLPKVKVSSKPFKLKGVKELFKLPKLKKRKINKRKKK